MLIAAYHKFRKQKEEKEKELLEAAGFEDV
jgi:hypothetical protein